MGDPHPLRAVMAGDRLPLTSQEAAEVLRNGRTTTDISTAVMPALARDAADRMGALSC